MSTEKDVHDGVSTPETTQVNTDPRRGGIPPVTGKAEHAYGEGELSHGEAARDENFYTRNGLNFESFKPRDYGRGLVELDRTMKSRHLHMIAIGGSIGAGFFVGSGGALSDGGPASVLIDFSIIGIMMFNVVYALGELAVMYPVSGGFYIYSSRFIDPSWGFAMGWNYVFQWAIVLPLELTVCAMTINYWEGARSVSPAVWISIFWIAIIVINTFGTLGYAEEEFWSSLLKLSAIVIFMIIAFILVLGGGPSHGRYNEYWGARHWYDPGAFNNGFKGFCAVFVTAAFSFAGTELVGLAAAESKNPLKSLPGAIKQVFWRITLFYILGLFFVGLLVPYNDPTLMNSDNAYADGASPFVIAANHAGLYGYDHFMNSIILISVLSLGVSCVYGGSRTLTALAQQGYAPKLFSYIDKSGRPLPSVVLHLVCGALAYITLDTGGNKVFSWLLSMSALAALFTWGSICLAHIRFRKAWAYHGHTVDEIPFKAALGVTGSWIGLSLCILVFIAQTYVAISPIGSDTNTAEGFFEAMLTVPVIIVFWIAGFIWKRTGWLRTHQMDVDTGRRELDWDEINRFKAEMATWPTWKRLMHKLF
ncbi:Amino-acid permease inda1 [Colletotrichum orbiculare MAFF 240422]|uniref:Amino-acid permease inda1 n=2 Tax=Colletotrichum orbiculare species complex TaxID=2707354 RepID=N4V9R9_COLOR|nr:Amino-acid permease inda1 [Colletotrichum orbiculare MAFF 240422]TDZ36224.1 Amino-acid permease inda1 [Colletotrichum spinosum]